VDSITFLGAVLPLASVPLSAVTGPLLLLVVLAGYGDRQLQQGALRDERQRMSESEGPQADDGVSTVEPESVDYEDFAELRRELERIEEDIDDRTVHREDIEADLKRYVRRQTRSGHARGWGPYLVLLYGTVMTLGAFYLLSGVWAILAMLVIWLSTLGLYTVMVMVGMTVSALAIPGRIRDFLSELRS
jgi:membrane protein